MDGWPVVAGENQAEPNFECFEEKIHIIAEIRVCLVSVSMMDQITARSNFGESSFGFTIHLI